MEPRSALHRLAPVALSALGIFGALLMIFAGLVALNHTVLPFKGWPLDGERLDTGKQVLPRAPVETGRLRTAPGGVLAGASPVLRGSLPVLVAPTGTTLTVTTVGGRLHAGRGPSHAALPQRGVTPVPQRPAAAPQPSAPAPEPAPAVTPTPAPAPLAVTAGPISRRPSTSTTSDSSPAHGNGNAAAPAHVHASGRSHAPGQLKKAAAAAVPAPAAAAAVPAGPDPASAAESDHGDGHGNGHGPPPWAHGHH